MPAREHFHLRRATAGQAAPTSAWSCRHCPQDCAPPALATLVQKHKIAAKRRKTRKIWVIGLENPQHPLPRTPNAFGGTAFGVDGQGLSPQQKEQQTSNMLLDSVRFRHPVENGAWLGVLFRP